MHPKTVQWKRRSSTQAQLKIKLGFFAEAKWSLEEPKTE